MIIVSKSHDRRKFVQCHYYVVNFFVLNILQLSLLAISNQCFCLLQLRIVNKHILK